MTRRKVRERRAQVLDAIKEGGTPKTRCDISGEFHRRRLRSDLEALVEAKKVKVEHHRLPWRPDEYKPVIKRKHWWQAREDEL